jgi:hypothetical protein
MPKFAYSAETVDGILSHGVQDAETLGEAHRKIA